MEREFESELGRSIARGEARHPKKVTATVAAVAVCALMFGSAAFLLPALAEDPLQLNKPVVWIDVNDGTQYDYVVYSAPDEDPETTDGLLHYSDIIAPDKWEVKRSMNLKVTDFDQPNSPDAGNEYNKFVYSMGVNVQSLANVGDWDKVVGTLRIPYDIVAIEDEIEASVTIAVNDVPALRDEIVEVVYDDEYGEIVVTVQLGTYTVEETEIVDEEEIPIEVEKDIVSGDYVSIQVLVKVPFYADVVDGDNAVEGMPEALGLMEAAFPQLDDY